MLYLKDNIEFVKVISSILRDTACISLKLSKPKSRVKSVAGKRGLVSQLKSIAFAGDFTCLVKECSVFIEC
jgi:hypothetical protein